MMTKQIDAYFPPSMTIQLQAHDGRWPLPDPRLLALHAAVGNVLHASGLAQYVEQALRVRESIDCLSEDGSTNLYFLQFLMAF